MRVPARRRLVPAGIVCGTLLVAGLSLTACAPGSGGSGERALQGGPGNGTGVARTHVVEAARTGLGAPYRLGGNGDPGFDCSGLIQYAYSQVGMSVPRTVEELREEVAEVDPESIQPGDLLFFRISGKLSHVGLYAGGDHFIHAPSEGKRVTYGSLESSYWQRHLAAAGSLF
ncbi:MAG: C40 family peptidase [Thiohalorhabdus sp.]|uniref:C40 family peptidase n=1 Tax=Thiohalorhabdus sp. TaxID=3094134 RepID=UPI00397F81E2